MFLEYYLHDAGCHNQKYCKNTCNHTNSLIHSITSLFDSRSLFIFIILYFVYKCNRFYEKIPEIEKHAEWAETLKKEYTFTPDNTEEILKAEIGKVFAHLNLSHAQGIGQRGSGNIGRAIRRNAAKIGYISRQPLQYGLGNFLSFHLSFHSNRYKNISI